MEASHFVPEDGAWTGQTHNMPETPEVTKSCGRSPTCPWKAWFFQLVSSDHQTLSSCSFQTYTLEGRRWQISYTYGRDSGTQLSITPCTWHPLYSHWTWRGHSQDSCHKSFLEITGPLFLPDGCTSSSPVGGAPHHLLSRRLGRTHGHVGLLNPTNLQQNLTTSGCWGCKSRWAKQCFNWWPIRLWSTLLKDYACGHSSPIYLTGRPEMLYYVLLLIVRQFVIYWYFKRDPSIKPLYYNHVLHVWVAFNFFWIWPGLLMLFLDPSWPLHFQMWNWLLNCRAFFLLGTSVPTITLKSTTLQGASLWAGALGKGAVQLHIYGARPWYFYWMNCRTPYPYNGSKITYRSTLTTSIFFVCFIMNKICLIAFISLKLWSWPLTGWVLN